MSTMVERVGKAMQVECREVFGSSWSNDVAWRLARTAIAAMREPSDEMIQPTTSVLADYIGDSLGVSDRDAAIRIWQAMIDAALAESAEGLPTPAK